MKNLTKAEFDALPEWLQSQFEADASGETFVYLAEDVAGLKNAKERILSEKKKLDAELAELRKYREQQEALRLQSEQERMKAAGEFEALEKKLREKLAQTEAEAEAKMQRLQNILKQQAVKNLLIEKGVLPERVEFALPKALEQFEMEIGEGSFGLRVRNGIGDPKEIEQAVAALREAAPFLFNATHTPGSGASGIGQAAAAAGTQWTRQQWENASTIERSEFTRAGGQVVD